MKKLFFLVISIHYLCFADNDKHSISFHEVSMEELLHFTSKISGLTFLFSPEDVRFDVSFISPKPIETKQVVDSVVRLLKNYNLEVSQQEDCLYVQKAKRNLFGSEKPKNPDINFSKYLSTSKNTFCVYKLQHNKGSEILQAVKQIADDIKDSNAVSPRLISAIASLQWIESTNSLLYSADDDTAKELLSLLERLDSRLSQVFIEVLVLETSVKNGMEFGLKWGGGGTVNDRMTVGTGNFGKNGSDGFAKNIEGYSPKKGLSQIPLGHGFDFGVIGDLIFHKGKTFLTLGSLLSALQSDCDSSVVLNQKIITQDSKESSIFVGDNIPFPGSRVETIGASQQTTSNIEYRDVGVKLNITPLIGSNDVITLNITEEISEATPTHVATSSSVHGIQTTKTNMLTRVHVPNNSFLVLSGMIRNNRSKRKTGMPCLGGLPLVGSAFSHTSKEDEKRNVIIFVRPRIVNTIDEYQEITDDQIHKYSNESPDQEFFNSSLQHVE